MIALAEEELTVWTAFEYELPTSAFTRSNGSSIVHLSDLMIAPDDSELSTLVIDPETNKQRLLTPAQKEQIRREGKFSFPSGQFPTVDHIWRISPWFQQGSVNIRKDFHARLGMSLDHVTVYLPDCLRGRYSFPLCDDRHSIPSALRGIVSLLLGLPERKPKYTEGDLSARLLMELRSYIRSELAELDLPPEPVVTNAASFRADLLPPEIATVRWRLTQDNLFDRQLRFRNYAAVAYASLARPLERAGDGQPAESLGVRRERMKREGELARRRQEEVAMFESPWIAKLCEEVGVTVQRLRDATRARYIWIDAMEEFYEQVEARLLALRAELVASHPVLGLSREWISRRIHSEMERRGEYHTLLRRYEQEAVERMEAENLTWDAERERIRIRFFEEIWPEREAQLMSELVPVMEFTHDLPNWKGNGERHGEHSQVELPRRRIKISTTMPLWRLGLVWNTFRSTMEHTAYFFAVTSLWRGPLGLQAMFRRHPFEKGGSDLGNSFANRLCGIWETVRNRRVIFERSGSASFLSKDTVRWLHYITNYGIRGVGSTIVVAVVQPTLTLLNVLFSAACVVLSPVVGVAGAVFLYATDVLFFDRFASAMHYFVVTISFGQYGYRCAHYSYTCDGEYTYVALLNRLLDLLQGILSFGWNAIGVVAHPMMAAARAAGACLGRGWRTFWDFCFRGLINRHGKWPSHDTWLAQRIAGPGISSTYYYRLPLEVTKACLLARLEQVELKIARSRLVEALDEPETQFRAFCDDVTHAFIGKSRGWNTSQTLAGITAFSAGQGSRGEALEKEFEERDKSLSALLDMPVDHDRIRPSGNDPVATLSACTELVETFYRNRLEPLGEEFTLDLWRAMATPLSNFRLLTESLLQEIFHTADFLLPLPTSDELLEIPIALEDLQIEFDLKDIVR